MSTIERRAELTMTTCPVNDNPSFNDVCKGCPFNRGWRFLSVTKGIVIIDCEKLTEAEEKLKAEPSKMEEPKSRW